MSGKRLGRNVVFNCAGIAVEMAGGFLMAPYLIRHLGATTYGLWVVLGALAGYFGLLDLGLRASVGRFVALHHARGDLAAVGRTLSVALAVLAAAGLLAAGAVLALAPALPGLFEVPADQADAARLALVLVGVNLGLSLVGNAFDAALWGLQRFDLLNMVDIPATALRVGLTILLVGRGGGLVTLAVVSLAATALAGSAKALLTFREARGLRLGRAGVTGACARELFGFGVWNFVASLARLTRTQLSPVLIGSLLGVALVAPFAVAARLIVYGASCLAAATGVLTPLATALHAQERHDRQRLLFVEGGKLCLTLSLYMLALYLFLGRSMIVLWVGPGLAEAAPLLALLALGELLPNAQSVTGGILLATARHRPLAYLNLVETAAVAVLTVVLVRAFGLVGACYALLLPGVVCRGVGQVVLGCRATGTTVARYAVESMLPALACAAPPAAALAALVAWHAPRTWPELAGYGAAFTLLSLGCGVFLVGPGRLRALLSRLASRPEPAAPATA